MKLGMRLLAACAAVLLAAASAAEPGQAQWTVTSESALHPHSSTALSFNRTRNDQGPLGAHILSHELVWAEEKRWSRRDRGRV